MRKDILRLLAGTLFITLVAVGATPASAAPAFPAGGAQQFKEHQATGTVKSVSSTRLVLIKQFGRNKTDWTFQLSGDTKMQGVPAKAARVTVYYHEEKGQRIADKIKVLPGKPGAAKAPPPGAPKPERPGR